MINIDDKAKCCGCTACASICPKKCINMKPDEEGFLYPEVDKSSCVDCHLCEKVCPVLNKVDTSGELPDSCAVRAKNIDTVMNSTSGGFFTPFANWIKERNGVICAAAYDNEFRVGHLIIDTKKEEIPFDRIRGSKYVQSDLNNCYVIIKELISQGRMVGFIGTTCQVAGLKAYIGDSENLITIDLVCHGTPSPKLWDKYLKYQRERYKSDIKEISFRNKTYGYHSSTMKIEFDNGKKYYGSARIDYMLKSFFKEISSRPICYECPFKTIDRCSDITLYDCWHISELVPELQDDDRGYTNIIIQSKQGRMLLEGLKDELDVYPVDTKKAVELDGIMVEHTAIPHDLRPEFYRDLDNESLRRHIQKFIPVTRKDYVLERVKGVLYNIGVLRLIKRVFKR